MRCGSSLARVGREEIRIEHEERNDLARVDRVAQRRVIRDAEVLAAEPDEGSHRILVASSRVRGSIGVFFALLAAAAGCAVWFDAALSWDGAYMLFKALDERTPFVPLARYTHFVLQAPAVLAQHAGVSDVRVLRAIFGAPFALVPLTSLALCWWIVREKRPGLFVWPVLSITLGNLGGAFFLVTEAPIATALFWPIVLALLVGSVTRLQACVLTATAALVFFAHPTAAPLFAGAGLLALFQGLRKAAGVRPRRWWIVAMTCLLLAGLRSLRPLTEYEARSFSLPSFARAFHVATWGWPRLSLLCTTIAAILILIHPFLSGRWKSRAMDRVLSVAPAVLAFAAGLLMVPWALDERAWAKALNYRFVAHVFSGIFLTVASLEGIVGERRGRRRSVACATSQRARGRSVVRPRVRRSGNRVARAARAVHPGGRVRGRAVRVDGVARVRRRDSAQALGVPVSRDRLAGARAKAPRLTARRVRSPGPDRRRANRTVG